MKFRWEKVEGEGTFTVFKSEGRVSLPAGVYFVRAGGRMFRVVVR